MRFTIDPKIFEQHPDLKIGVILVKGLDNSRRISAIESLLRGICAQRKKEFEDKEINDENEIRLWNEAYGKFGINPNKFPCSIAGLLKRIKSGKELPHINALVDLYNYFSLKYLFPIGGEDLDWLCGDLRLTFTKGEEPFRAIGSIEVDRAKEGEVAYMDDGGITCRYWNNKECERTKFTQKTVNAAIIIEDLSRMHMDEFGRILREIQNSMIKYIGGQIEPYILTEEKTSIDLGIVGRKMADDSKIPQQEIAHYMEANLKKKVPSSSEQVVKKPIKTEKKSKKTLFSKNTSLKTKINELLAKAVKKTFDKKVEIKVEYPSTENFGDYSSNVAMQFSKEMGKSPREIAEIIISNIPKNDIIEKVEIAGPGFINFFVAKVEFENEIEEILKEKDKYGSESENNKNIVLDYSSPNIAKPLGVHHLLSTIIGQTLYNILSFTGYKCVSVNHIGDWGTQFGKLICAYKKWGKREDIEKDPINEMLKLYVKFHEEAEKDPVLEDEARKEFKNLEEGESENRELLKWFVDESMKDINKTYEKLSGIHFDYTQGESFYEDKMAEILKEGKDKKIFVEGDEGSYIVKYDDPNIAPFVVQKKDGATLYSTRDLTALKYRLTTWSPEKILYVVDTSQQMHFSQLFAAAKRFPWYKDEGEHVWFGRMRMKDSTMSTRKGNIILLNDLLEEAETRAQKIIEEKNPDLKNKKEVAEIIGMGAVKYNILSQNRTTDIVFDWDKMLSLEGNSAPYLQYSYARAKSILRKAKNPTKELIKDKEDGKAEEKINGLIRLFPKFKEQIIFSAEEYKPNILSNYLYELAQKFNSFYNSVPVLVEDEGTKNKRLKIVAAASQILKNGLKLLGVEVVEEM